MVLSIHEEMLQVNCKAEHMHTRSLSHASDVRIANPTLMLEVTTDMFFGSCSQSSSAYDAPLNGNDWEMNLESEFQRHAKVKSRFTYSVLEVTFITSSIC